MKGNIKENFCQSFKKRLPIVAVVIVAIALVLLLVFALKGCNDDGNTGGYRPTLPEIQLNGDDGYIENAPQQGIELPATTGLVFNGGSKTQSVDFYNPSKNQCVVTVSLYLADGTLLYESDYLRPSDVVQTIEISRELKTGLYKGALMVYNCYSMTEPYVPISRCEFPIEIRCV